MTRILRTLVVVVCILLFLPVTAPGAGETPGSRGAGGPAPGSTAGTGVASKIGKISVRDASIRMVLAMVSRVAGIEILLDSRVRGRIDLEVSDTSVGEVLQHVAEAAGARLELREGVYVITTDPPGEGTLERIAPEASVAPPPEPPVPEPLQQAVQVAVIEKIVLKHCSVTEIAALFTEPKPAVPTEALGTVVQQAINQTFLGLELPPEPWTEPPLLPAQQVGVIQSASRRPRQPQAVGGGFRQLLPEGIVGSIVPLPEENALLVGGTREALDQLKEVLRVFEQPVKWIKLEVEIVEIEDPNAALFNGFLPVPKPPGGEVGLRVARGPIEARVRELVQEGRAKILAAAAATTENNQPVVIIFGKVYPYYGMRLPDAKDGEQAAIYEPRADFVGWEFWLCPRLNADDTVTLDLQTTYAETAVPVTAPVTASPKGLFMSSVAHMGVTVALGETLVVGGFPPTLEELRKQQRPGAEQEPQQGDLTELILLITPRELPRPAL